MGGKSCQLKKTDIILSKTETIAFQYGGHWRVASKSRKKDVKKKMAVERKKERKVRR